MPAGTNSSIVGVTGPEMRVQQRVRVTRFQLLYVCSSSSATLVRVVASLV